MQRSCLKARMIGLVHLALGVWLFNLLQDNNEQKKRSQTLALFDNLPDGGSIALLSSSACSANFVSMLLSVWPEAIK